MRTATLNLRPLQQLVGSVLFVVVLSAITWAGLRAPLIAAALLYVTAFVVLAWAKPAIALMLIFAGAPFQNDLSGGGSAKMSIGEINLALTAGVCIIQRITRREPIRWGPIAIPVAIYLAICVYSTLRNWYGGAAVLSILQMVLYLVVTVMVFATFPRSAPELRLTLYGLVCVGVLFTVIGLVSHSNYYLGIHKNGLGGSLGVATVVATELWLAEDDPKRKRLLGLGLLIITVGLVQSLSRGAWAATFTGLVIIFYLRRQFGLLVRTFVLLIPVVALSWTLLPAESKAYSTDLKPTLKGSVGTRITNATVALSFFEKSPITGAGVGLRKMYDATNLTLFTLAETGILGLAAFLSIHLVFLRMVGSARRYLTPADPAFSLLAVGAALLIGKLVHGQVDHYWSRGQVLMAWAGAGMAVWAYFESRTTRPHRSLQDGQS